MRSFGDLEREYERFDEEDSTPVAIREAAMRAVLAKMRGPKPEAARATEQQEAA